MNNDVKLSENGEKELREREPWEVEKYFGILLDAFDEDSYEYQVMMRIQCDYDNDTRDCSDEDCEE